MGQERMDAVIRQQYENCIQLGKAVAEDFAEEDIHVFRVEIKRFRALLRLAAAAGHSHIKPKLPRGLKVYYAMTGVLRNLQLQKKSLEEAAVRMHQGPPAKCLAVLDDRIGMTENMVRLYLQSSDPFSKERAEWHEPVTHHVAEAAGENFIAAKTKASIVSGGVGQPDDEQLHAIRKGMKDLLYSWPYFSKKNIEHGLSQGMPAREHLEDCTRVLGDFRDVIVQLSLLKDRRFLLCTCPQSARFLEAAEQLWLGDKQALLEKIKGLLLPCELHVD